MRLDRRLLDLLGDEGWPTAVTLSLSLGLGLVIAAQAWILSHAVSAVFLGGDGLRGISSSLLTLAGLALSRAVLQWLRAGTAASASARLRLRLRERALAHVFHQGGGLELADRSGDLAATLLEGIEALDPYFRSYLPQLATAVMIPLALLAIALPNDPLSGFVLLVTAPLIPFFMILIGRTAESRLRDRWGSLQAMSAHFLDVLQGLRTLKELGQSRQQRQRIREVSVRFRRSTMGVLRVAFLSALVLELAASLSIAVVAVQIGLRLLAGRLAFETGFFILLLAPEFYLPMRRLGAAFHEAAGGLTSADGLFEILEAPLPTAPARRRPASPDLTEAPLALRSVTCHHPARRRASVAEVSMALEPGAHLAVIGPSGAGKTTLALLLLRFLQPTAGTLSLGDVPARAFDVQDWRRQIAWVPQNPTLFNGTVADNLRLADPNASAKQLAWAAESAGVESILRTLPKGMDTRVGERGLRLSAGQVQQFALARAFLKDSPVLILDEPTAQLDPRSEARVASAVRRLMAGRSVLLITHRLNLAAEADRILLMQGGRIVESGTHRQLLGGGGLYRDLAGAFAGVRG